MTNNRYLTSSGIYMNLQTFPDYFYHLSTISKLVFDKFHTTKQLLKMSYYRKRNASEAHRITVSMLLYVHSATSGTIILKVVNNKERGRISKSLNTQALLDEDNFQTKEMMTE